MIVRRYYCYCCCCCWCECNTSSWILRRLCPENVRQNNGMTILSAVGLCRFPYFTSAHLVWRETENEIECYYMILETIYAFAGNNGIEARTYTQYENMNVYFAIHIWHVRICNWICIRYSGATHFYSTYTHINSCIGIIHFICAQIYFS